MPYARCPQTWSILPAQRESDHIAPGQAITVSGVISRTPQTPRAGFTTTKVLVW